MAVLLSACPAPSLYHNSGKIAVINTKRPLAVRSRDDPLCTVADDLPIDLRRSPFAAAEPLPAMKTSPRNPVCLVIALTVLLGIGYGCGLGYLEPAPPVEGLAVRIENPTDNPVEIKISTSGLTDEDGEVTPLDLGDGSAQRQAQVALTNEAIIRVEAGATTTGVVLCNARIEVAASVIDTGLTPVTLAGDGTGTTGFDSGSVGLQGERVLFNTFDFECVDTILVRVNNPASGEVRVVRPGEEIPDPVDGGPAEERGDLTFRLDNATATDANIIISSTNTVEGVDPPGQILVQVPPGEYTAGTLPCGFTYKIEGTIEGTSDSIVFDGEGTGTEGFDSGSVGPSGERFLQVDEHYLCKQTVVVTVTDDGTGVGSSVSETPTGTIDVYNYGEAPAPNLPRPGDDGGDDGQTPTEKVRVRIRNATTAFVQVNLTRGTGSGDTSVDVRVPPLASSEGTLECASRFTVEANHLEDADSAQGSGFHTVILLGDGTGADGFDGNNIGTDNTRTLRLDEHYECGDLIEVTIESTGNSFDPDSGDPIYGIGSGTVTVID